MGDVQWFVEAVQVSFLSSEWKAGGMAQDVFNGKGPHIEFASRQDSNFLSVISIDAPLASVLRNIGFQLLDMGREAKSSVQTSNAIKGEASVASFRLSACFHGYRFAFKR